MEKGICWRCGEKFGFGLSFGYCSSVCAEEVLKEEREISIKEYPYAVIDFYGHEEECFKTTEEADDYLRRVCSSMEIVKREL